MPSAFSLGCRFSPYEEAIIQTFRELRDHYHHDGVLAKHRIEV